jgi:hypothetical protein
VKRKDTTVKGCHPLCSTFLINLIPSLVTLNCKYELYIHLPVGTTLNFRITDFRMTKFWPLFVRKKYFRMSICSTCRTSYKISNRQIFEHPTKFQTVKFSNILLNRQIFEQKRPNFWTKKTHPIGLRFLVTILPLGAYLG